MREDGDSGSSRLAAERTSSTKTGLGGRPVTGCPSRFTHGVEEADAEQRRSSSKKRVGVGGRWAALLGAGNFLWVSEV